MKNLKFFLFILLALCIFFTQRVSFLKKPEKINPQPQEEIQEERNLQPFYKIKINPPVPLSYKSKEEIFSLRKSFVSNSVFSKAGYKPSDSVFGQIVGDKPWISVNRCTSSEGHSRVKGNSEESRDINNPSILVTIDFPMTFHKEYLNSYLEEFFIKYRRKALDICNVLILPKSASYDSKKRELEVVYESLPFAGEKFQIFYTLKGLNARDFGYNYAYVDRALSKNLVDFRSDDNISTSVFEFQDFLHLGGSCGVEGGCNNGSPYCPWLTFNYNNISKETVIYIKLWKKRPLSKNDKADIVEKIIILPY